jgi:hypothetical protein
MIGADSRRPFLIEECVTLYHWRTQKISVGMVVMVKNWLFEVLQPLF